MKLKLFVVLILILLSVFVSVNAQTKTFLSGVPKENWYYDDTLAANCFYQHWYFLIHDTVANIYLGKSVYLQTDYPVYGVNRAYQFRVDSIVGRGDKRQVLFTVKQKLQNPGQWIWLKERYLGLIPDSLYWKYMRVDTVGLTTDSTYMYSTWLKYLTNDDAGSFFQYPIVYIQNQYSLQVWLEKILGDPTKPLQTQQCKLHFQMRQQPPPTWMNKFINK
jgi:hypothetical protein